MIGPSAFTLSCSLYFILIFTPLFVHSSSVSLSYSILAVFDIAAVLGTAVFGTAVFAVLGTAVFGTSSIPIVILNGSLVLAFFVR